MTRRLTSHSALLLVVVVLAGCSSTRLGSRDDTTPPPISPEAVFDAVPRPDPILPRGNTSPYTVNGKTYEVLSSASGYVEEGIASWYGLKFHGRPTSTGERFSVYQATAAHRSLPLPTYARVTNLDNDRQIVVKVNDRGPFHEQRIIDLSYGAAVKLGFVDQGTARVRVEAITVAGTDDRRDVGNGRYRRLQFGAFAAESAAESLAQRIRLLLPVAILVIPIETPDGSLYRVRSDAFVSESALRQAQQKLELADLPTGQPLP